MVRSVIDGSSCHFRLKNGRNRLSFSRQSALYPAKLRRVDSRHLDHGGFHFAVIVKEFGSQRGEETEHGMLRSTVGGLKRDASVRERGTHVHNHSAVSWQHAFQCSEGTIYVSQICHFRDAFEFLCGHLLNGREHGCHRVVYPDIDGSEFPFHLFGCRFDFVRMGNIHRKDEGFSARGLHLASSSIQAISTARDQSDRRAVTSELPNRCAAHARRRAGNHHDFRPFHVSSLRGQIKPFAFERECANPPLIVDSQPTLRPTKYISIL